MRVAALVKGAPDWRQIHCHIESVSVKILISDELLA